MCQPGVIVALKANLVIWKLNIFRTLVFRFWTQSIFCVDFCHNSPLSDCLSASLWHGSLFHPKKGKIVIFCCIIKNLPDSPPDLSLSPIPSFPSACDQIYCHRSPISFLKDKILFKTSLNDMERNNVENGTALLTAPLGLRVHFCRLRGSARETEAISSSLRK